VSGRYRARGVGVRGRFRSGRTIGDAGADGQAGAMPPSFLVSRYSTNEVSQCAPA